MFIKLLIPVTIIFAWMPALILLGVMVFSFFHGLINGFSPQQQEMALTSGTHVFLFALWTIAVVLSFWAMCSICFGLRMNFLWRLIALLIGTLAYLIPFVFFLPLIASFSLQGLMTAILSLLAIAALIHLIHAFMHLRLIVKAEE